MKILISIYNLENEVLKTIEHSTSEQWDWGTVLPSGNVLETVEDLAESWAIDNDIDPSEIEFDFTEVS